MSSRLNPSSQDARWSSPFAAMKGAPGPARPLSLLMERCFGSIDSIWSDALISRMRRHIGGCVCGVETSLRLELERLAREYARGINSLLPDSICWRELQHHPDLLGRGLVVQFRDRAAISLMTQENMTAADGRHRPPPEYLFRPDIADGLTALSLVQKGWTDNSPDELPMRADLPAEAMEELVWVVMALLADRLVPAGLMPQTDMLMLCDRAGRAFLARYDEETAPYIASMLLVHKMRGAGAKAGAGIRDDHLLWLARNRHVMMLLAIMADRLAIEMATLVSAFAEERESLLFRLCRAADFPREVAVRLMLGRRAICRGVEDSVLVEYADTYECLSRDDAILAVAPYGIASGFRDKLAFMQERWA